MANCTRWVARGQRVHNRVRGATVPRLHPAGIHGAAPLLAEQCAARRIELRCVRSVRVAYQLTHTLKQVPKPCRCRRVPLAGHAHLTAVHSVARVPTARDAHP